MSKHASTLLASEAVEVLVDEHMVVKAVLTGKRCVTDETDKWLYSYNAQKTHNNSFFLLERVKFK